MRKTYVIEIETDHEDIESVLRDLASRAAQELCDVPTPTIVLAYELNVGLSTICSGDMLAEFQTFSLEGDDG